MTDAEIAMLLMLKSDALGRDAHIIHAGKHEDITKPLAEGKEIVILGPGGGSGVDLTRPATGTSGRPLRKAMP